jgi:hypothetical protein
LRTCSARISENGSDNENSKMTLEDINSDRESQDSDVEDEAGCVLVFVVRNFAPMKQTVVFHWNDDNRSQFNLRLPVNSMQCQIDAKHDKLVLRLSKLRPLQEWGPLNQLFQIEVIQPEIS